jgi:GntR family transcriptional regulator, transcriptional repressor for pyruvate dehydrogenase complex
MRQSLSQQVASQLLDGIVDGRYPPEGALPPEAEIARQSGVSRLTVREAVKTLVAGNVVRVDPGRGTFTNPPDRWTGIDALALLSTKRAASARGVVLGRMIEARRIIEVGAAELAATRRTDEDLASIHARLDEMRAAVDQDQLDEFVRADLAFHQAVLDAAGNAFISVLLNPLRPALLSARRLTSEIPDVRRHAIGAHLTILSAIEARDPDAARLAMNTHIQETYVDTKTYVLDPEEAAAD